MSTVIVWLSRALTRSGMPSSAFGQHVGKTICFFLLFWMFFLKMFCLACVLYELCKYLMGNQWCYGAEIERRERFNNNSAMTSTSSRPTDLTSLLGAHHDSQAIAIDSAEGARDPPWETPTRAREILVVENQSYHRFFTFLSIFGSMLASKNLPKTIKIQ